MKRSWLTARLGAVAMLVVAGSLAVATVEAKPERKNDERPPKDLDRPEWSDPMVQGVITKVWWADGYTKGEWIPSAELFSVESDNMVTVYGNSLQVQDLFKNGTACVGRFIVATGNRIDQWNLSARGMEVPNLDMACTTALGPPPR